MNVLKCLSLPVIVIKMTIGKMEKEGRAVWIYNGTPEANGNNFYAPISTSLAAKLSPGDSVAIVCIPATSMDHALETLALVKKRSDSMSEVLYDKGGYAQYLPHPF